MMPVAVCYICKHNDPSHPENHAPVYADCASCEAPTCKKHGRDNPQSVFYCVRCMSKLGMR
jgi:hypothetical protein